VRTVKKLAVALILAVLAAALIVVGAQVAMGMLINSLSLSGEGTVALQVLGIFHEVLEGPGLSEGAKDGLRRP
jgi:hypothetical protein